MPAATLAEAFEQARSMDAPFADGLAAYAQASRELNATFADAESDRHGSRVPPSAVPVTRTRAYLERRNCLGSTDVTEPSPILH
jgi:hypothetical protein